MAIKQLTVFIQNRKGTVVSVTDILSKNHVNLRALSIAETQDFGILRLIVNDERTAEAVLAEGGSSFEKAVKTTCFLADINDFADFNQVYGKYFTTKPARSCVAVKTLPKGVLVEVEVIALI